MTTITAAQLQHMLDQVKPHMSTDDTLPVINSVHLEVRDGYLFAAATDRYTLAVSRVAVTTADNWTHSFIPGENLPALEAWLEAAVGTVTLAVSNAADDGTLTITGKTGSMTIAYNSRAYKNFPSWRNLVRNEIDSQPQPVSLTGFTTKYLARWQQAGTVIQCWQNKPSSPLIVMGETGDFLGLQMPVRHEISRNDLTDQWRRSLTRVACVDDREYSLDIQWSDSQGDPWEYTGKDRFNEPLMRLVGIDDDHHTLAQLVKQYGPLTPLEDTATA